MVYPLSEHEKLSLGGVGIEIYPRDFERKYTFVDVFPLLSKKRSA